MAGTSWRMRRLALWGMGMWPMRADLAQLATALYAKTYSADSTSMPEISNSIHRQALTLFSASESIKEQKFIIERKKSSLSGAGVGVFMTKGSATPGTLLGFYPGDVYREKAVLTGTSLEYTAVWKDGVMDGHPSLETVIKASSACSYSLGNLINHPSESFLPNSVFYPFEFPRSMFERYGHLIPSRSRDANEWPVPGQAVVAIRDISQGEELFVDYDFSTETTLECSAWYTPVSREDKMMIADELFDRVYGSQISS
ncbi:hypothetical protein AAMO2058_000974100 [Amorphochlora amoebiformis]